MNVTPALLLVGGLLPLVAQVVSSCQETNPAAVAGTPIPSPTPVTIEELKRYTPDDLAAYAGYCATQARLALARGDTAAAHSWDNTRSAVQAEMKRYSQRDRPKRHHHAGPSPTPKRRPVPTPTPEEPTRRPGDLLPPNWPVE